MARVAFQTAVRAAAVTLLTDYKEAASINLQIYRARPATIRPPTAFVDEIAETITYTALHQRVPTASVVVLHGLFDHGDTVDQRDAFVDGFLDWCLDRYHAAGANTLLAVTEVRDEPAYVPEWLSPENQRTYYATRIELEGFAASG